MATCNDKLLIVNTFMIQLTKYMNLNVSENVYSLANYKQKFPQNSMIPQYIFFMIRPVLSGKYLVTCSLEYLCMQRVQFSLNVKLCQIE